MKRKTCIVLFVLISFAIQGQITVKETSIPRIGDTLHTMVDNLPQMIDPGLPGENKSWDFSSLQAPFVRQTVFLPAGEGAHSNVFPKANAVTFPGASVENYYRIENDRIEEVGVFGMDPTGLNLEIYGRYSNPLLIKTAPLNYGDAFQLETELVFPVSADKLPDTLTNMIPLEFDSLRLNVEIERFDRVDAWGMLTLPDGQAEVLREKRVEVRKGKIEVFHPFTAWYDVTEFVEGLLPLDIPENDSIVNYFFFDEESIEPMAMITMDSTGNVSRAEYKAGQTTEVETLISERPDVFVYPNPSFGEVRFELTNLPSGVYELEVMNILGVSIWENEYYVNGSKVIPVDLTDIRRGTYFYRLVDKKEHTIVTKRLVLIRP